MLMLGKTRTTQQMDSIIILKEDSEIYKFLSGKNIKVGKVYKIPVEKLFKGYSPTYSIP
jgi:hypothetical protein